MALNGDIAQALDKESNRLAKKNEARQTYNVIGKKLEEDLWFKFRMAANMVKGKDVNPYRLAAAVGEAAAIMDMIESLKRNME